MEWIRTHQWVPCSEGCNWGVSGDQFATSYRKSSILTGLNDGTCRSFGIVTTEKNIVIDMTIARWCITKGTYPKGLYFEALPHPFWWSLWGLGIESACGRWGDAAMPLYSPSTPVDLRTSPWSQGPPSQLSRPPCRLPDPGCDTFGGAVTGRLSWWLRLWDTLVLCGKYWFSCSGGIMCLLSPPSSM